MKDKRIDSIFIDIEKQNNEKVKKLFLEVGIDAPNRDGRTLFIQASFYNNLELIHFALENGANSNHQDNRGYTALHFAVQEQHISVIELLLQNKIQIDLQDQNGNSALWRAAMDEVAVPIIQKLLENGANPHLKNKHDVSPFDLMDQENEELMKWLRN